MSLNMFYLYDKQFLDKLAHQRIKSTYVKIESYNKQGLLQDVLEGLMTSGSVNIDGSSALRRSCQLTFDISNEQVDDFVQPYWNITTRIKVYIGIKNTVDPITYGDIVWFPQGDFLISSFNWTEHANKTTININGVDKMAKLNGEFGGEFTGLTNDLGKGVNAQGEEVSLTLKEIIINLLVTMGDEDFHNIIIMDLDDELGVELLEYRGDEPLYLFQNIATKTYEHFYTDKTTKCYLNGTEITLDSKDLKYIKLNKQLIVETPSIITLTLDDEAPQYNVILLEYGDPAGYKLLNSDGLIYAGELILNLGETVTTALDKIVGMLGNYEYFYNLDGQFVFQKKRNHLTLTMPESFLLNSEDNTSLRFDITGVSDITAFDFSADELVVSKSHQQNFSNIKNDFIVWGKRDETPIHMRYAIDNKPVAYTCCSYPEDRLKKYPARIQREYTSNEYDWRELIYQMAYDWYWYRNQPDFYAQLNANNPSLVHCGKTGYERYYTDMLSFWRMLYDPNPQPYYKRVPYEILNTQNAPTPVFIPKLEPYDSTNMAHSNKEQIYVVSEDDSVSENNINLIRWIDSIDMTNLIDYPLNNLYIEQNNKKIQLIDTLSDKFETEMTYIYDSSTQKYISVFETLSAEEKQHVYISRNKYSEEKVKFEDYMDLSVALEKSDELEAFGSAFYACLKNETTYRKIDSISILFPDKITKAYIWKFDYDLGTIDAETIKLLNTAIASYKTNVFVTFQQDDQEYTISEIENFQVFARYSPAGKILWYCDKSDDGDEDGVKYIYFNDYFLHTSSNKNPQTNKYNVYFKDDEAYVCAKTLIKVDKAQVWYISSSSTFAVQNKLIDLLQPSGLCYYWHTDQYIALRDLTEANPLMQIIYTSTGGYIRYLETFQFLLDGSYQSFDPIKQQELKYYERYYEYNYDPDDPLLDLKLCWHLEILSDFNKAQFWFDFLPLNQMFAQYNIKEIGGYTKTLNNDQITKFMSTTPDILYHNDATRSFMGYDSALMDNETIERLFMTARAGRSALSAVENELNQIFKTNITSSISILPIYWLDVNQQICLHNKNILSSLYEITRITIPLAYNGQMSLELQILE